MKRIINIISITLGIFIFTACQDELNNEPIPQIFLFGGKWMANPVKWRLKMEILPNY